MPRFTVYAGPFTASFPTLEDAQHHAATWLKSCVIARENADGSDMVIVERVRA